MKAKCNQRRLGGAKTVSPVSLALLKEGGKFLSAENVPLPRLFIFRCRDCSPRRANLPFFLGGKHKHGPMRVGARLFEPTQGRLGIHF